MKNTKKLIAILVAALLLVSILVIPQTVSAYDYKTMRDITAYDLVSEMTVGINIGNSLDSALSNGSSETAWGNPKITKQLILAYKEAGFNTIRLPVTWKGYMESNGAPKSIWLDRVQEVTDWILEQGLYCIINTHHEQSWLNTSSTGMDTRKEKFKNLWTGIATRFKDYGDHLLFEGFNEILKSEGNWSAASNTDYANSNALSQVFVDAVRATGGKNAKRILISSTYGAIHTTNGFVLPKDTAIDKLAVEFHSYYPQAFCFSNGNQTIWGTTSDNNTVDNYCQTFYNAFSSKKIPVILGEFGAVNKHNTADRVDYAKKVISSCEKYDIMPIWWDNGVLDTDGDDFGLFNRDTTTNVFPEIVGALVGDSEAAARTTAKPTTTVDKSTQTTKTIIDWDAKSHWYISTSDVSYGKDGVTLTKDGEININTWSNNYEDYKGIRLTIINNGTSTIATIKVISQYTSIRLYSGVNHIDINLASMGITENASGDFNIKLNGTSNKTIISDVILYKDLIEENTSQTTTTKVTINDTTTRTTVAKPTETTKTIVDWDAKSHWYISTSNVSYGKDGVTLTKDGEININTWSNNYEDYKGIRLTITNNGTSTSASIRVTTIFKTVKLTSGVNHIDINLASMGIAKNASGDFNIKLNGTSNKTVISDVILYKDLVEENTSQTTTTKVTINDTTTRTTVAKPTETTKTIVDWDAKSHWYISTSNVSYGKDGVTLTKDGEININTWSNNYEDYKGIRLTITNNGTFTSASIRVTTIFKTVKLTSGVNHIDINLASMGIAENAFGDFNIKLNGTSNKTVISDVILYK